MANRKIISLFTGAGGLDLGLEAAGFQTKVAVEKDATAIATLHRNRELGRIDWNALNGDIHAISTDVILRAGQLKRGEAALLVGGPPCQPFSKSGFWKTGDSKRLDDPRASTLSAYLRVLDEARPHGYLLENVEGLSYAGKSEGLDYLRQKIEDLGYSFNLLSLNAAEYGVPQLRKRVVITGSLDRAEVQSPPKTHVEIAVQLEFLRLQPFTTTWDAIGDLEVDPDDPDLSMGGKWAALLPSIPEGQNYLFHTDRGDGLPLFGWRRRYWSFLLKLSKELPSWTITAQPGSAIGPFHWQNRKLHRKELGRLQTFPDDYEIIGSHSAAQRQIGNAVPSALGELLGYHLRRELLGESVVTTPLKLIPNRSESVPPPEPTQDVVEKYRTLVGDHAPHPGTGEGYGAQTR